MHSGGIGPVIRDGWVCRACWKPNLADETVCYRCKTPRGEQLKVEMGSKVREIDPMFGKRGRLDIEWPVLAYLVSWPLGFDGALGILTGFLGFALGGVLTGEEETILGMDVGTFLMLVAVASIALSVLRIFVARSIQRFARWAYVVAIALTLLGSVPYLVGALPVPYEAGTLSASIHTFRVWVNLAMFFGAIALLVMSFIRRDPSMTDAPEPAPMPVPRPAASAPAAEPHRPLIEPSSGRVAFRNQPPDDPRR